jgi:copper(I)-binding protein
LNSAVYFSLLNTSIEDILLEVRGEVAEEIRLHETIIDAAGTARMAHQERVPLGANQRLEFEPGGLHVMLIRLLRPLEPGDTFDLALLFLQQGEIHVQVAVENR